MQSVITALGKEPCGVIKKYGFIFLYRQYSIYPDCTLVPQLPKNFQKGGERPFPSGQSARPTSPRIICPCAPLLLCVCLSPGAEVNASPLWNLAQVKMEPQENEEANVHGHGVLGSDVFEEPMSGMSEAGMPQSPNGSESSYGSHSADSLMGSSPVFNQRCKKKMKKM